MTKTNLRSLTTDYEGFDGERPIRVLHVDDEVGLLTCAKQILEMQGPFQVKSASSVSEALERMREKEFDVVVSDYQMPEKDGLDFLKELRKNGNDIPFILFTGKGREDVVINALNLGADKYFNKIGHPEAVYGELAHGIRTLVKTRHDEQELRKFKTISDKAGYGVKILDLEGNILYVNESFAKMHGYNVKELLGKNNSIFHTKHGHDLVERSRKKLFEKGYVVMEERHLKKDGSLLPVLVNATLMEDTEGSPLYVAVVVTDITERKRMEEVLRQEREMLETVTQNVGAGLTIISKDYHILWANKVVNDVFADAKGKICYEIFHQRTSVCPGCGVKEIFETGKNLVVHQRAVKELDGQNIYVENITTPIRDKNGNITAALELSVNITERKQMEQELEKSEEKYRKQFEQAMDAIFLGDPDTGILVDCNRAATELVGRKKSELIGKHQRILHPPEEIEGEFSRTFKRHLKEKEGQVMETQVITKNGEIRDVAIKANIFELENKRIMQGAFRDITERKRMEEALQESEENYRRMIEHAPDLIVTIDEKGIVTSCNPALERGTDYFQHEIIGKHFIETPLLYGIDPAYAQRLFNAIIEEKHPEPIELTWFLNDGTPRISEVRIGLMKKDGKLAGFTAVARDITERKRAVEKLRQLEERYRHVFENTGTAMCILEEDKTISMVNKQFEELSGYSWKELEGKKWTEFVTQEYLERMKRYHEERRKKGKKPPTHYNFDFVDKKGQTRSCLLTINMMPGTKKSVASVLDITEQKKTENALNEAEEKHRETIVNANVGIIGYSPDGEVKILNPKMEQITGFKRSEIPTLRDWFEKLYPNEEERQKVMDKWFKRMLEDGEVKKGHAIITTKDDKRRNFLFNGVQLESGDSIAFAEDITEQKEAEEKLDRVMTELVAINEKLGVVGKLTRHDVRNKLSVIVNNVYLAKQRLAGDQVASEYLEEVESAVNQAEKIFDFASTYEKVGIEELSYINVGKSIEEAFILFSGLAEIRVVNECHGLTVLADTLLRQLVYNLLHNSVVHGENVSLISFYYKEEKDQLKLIYDDNGVGISEGEKALIFGECYGKGTGYGLYLIRKICEAYGWTIQEIGAPGKGAQFVMSIPKTNKSGKTAYNFIKP